MVNLLWRLVMENFQTMSVTNLNSNIYLAELQQVVARSQRLE
jgi:hypothetical protein